MELIKVHYRTPHGCFMDILGINEIDIHAPIIESVYRVETDLHTYHGNEAKNYLRNLNPI